MIDGQVRAVDDERRALAFKLGGIAGETRPIETRIRAIDSEVSAYDRINGVQSFAALPHRGLDLVVAGKAACFELGEDQVAVDTNLEPTATGGDDGECGDVVLVLAQQTGRQTDGFVQVTSGSAVFDFNFLGHGEPPKCDESSMPRRRGDSTSAPFPPRL